MKANEKGRTDWETPGWLFDVLHEEFRFDVDAAASDDNAKLPQYWTTETNGLAQSWGGRRVFCNPPYGRQTQAWVEKAVAETRSACPLAVLIVPANVETFWWHDLAMPHVAEIRFVRRRVHFLLNGKRVCNGRPVFASAVLIFKGIRQGPCTCSTLFAPDPKILHNGRPVLQPWLFGAPA